MYEFNRGFSMFSSLPLAFLVTRSPTDKLIQNFLNNPFAGIHQLAWFDWAMLIPYFTVLLILSVYGLHRYDIIRTYFKHRKNATGEPAQALRPAAAGHHPASALQRALRGGAADRRNREDGLSEGTAADPGAGRFHRRYGALRRSAGGTLPRARLPDRVPPPHQSPRLQGRGACRKGLKTATGELVAVFDADFIPPADFLMRTVHYFTDPKVGVVQTRWSYLNRDYNFLTEVEAMLLDGHFILEHGARSRAGYFFNFNGTAGILRKAMIDDAGGWQHDTLTEDSDLSYRAQLKGWRFVYLPGLDCPSELPVEMHGFQVQQSRWAKGLTQVAMKLLPAILKAPISRRVKAEAFLHLTPNISYPLMIVVSALMLPVMIVRFYMGVWEMVFLDLPLIAASFWSISLFYVVAQRELYPEELEAVHLPAADADGGRRGADDHQHARRAGSAVRRRDQLRAHAEVRDRRASGEAGEQEVPAAQRLAALSGAGRSGRTSWGWWSSRSRPTTSSRFRSCAVRVRLLLGRLRDAVPGTPEPAAVAEGARPGRGPAGLIRTGSTSGSSRQSGRRACGRWSDRTRPPPDCA